MKKFNCNKCNSTDVFIDKKNTNMGLYCSDCGGWIKWLGRDELRIAKRYIDLMEKNKIMKHDEVVDAINFLKSINSSCDNCAVTIITGECTENCTIPQKNRYLNLAIKALEHMGDIID